MQLNDESGAPHNDNRSSEIGWQLLDDLMMGLGFYSRLPAGARPGPKPVLSRMALALPFTSLVIGALPAALLVALEWLGAPHYFAAAFAVAAMVVVTGAMAEDAIADAADGLGGGTTQETRLEIMKDSRHGTYGVVAIALLLLLRVAAIGAIADPLAAAGIWLTATMLGRSGALWLTLALPPARSSGASAASGRVSARAFAIGGAFALILSFVLAGFAVGVLGLIVAWIACAAMVLVWVALCRRLVGGQTGDLIGALQALLEIAVLSAFMIFI